MAAMLVKGKRPGRSFDVAGTDETVEEALRRAGCVFADDEARMLRERAGSEEELAELVRRRCAGTPLPWLLGGVRFCGRWIAIDEGVYVPRPHSELLAERAAELLPPLGRAVDLATGSGAVAAVLMERRRDVHVVGVDLDPRACACARRNGVTVLEGDLLHALAPQWRSTLDVLVGVLPYVPTAEIGLLGRNARDEPRDALDGGPDGLAHVRRVAGEAPAWLRPGGHLLLEIGGHQDEVIVPELHDLGYAAISVLRDVDGDVRAVTARR